MTHYRDGAVEPRFAELMYHAANALGVSIAEERIRSYAKLLHDVPFAAVRTAFERALNDPVRRGQGWFPQVGELRGYLGPTEDEAALLAWSGLRGLASAAGAWREVVIEDGAAAAALTHVFGDWPSFCDEDDGPGLAMKRREFLAVYRRARADGTHGATRLHGLTGPPPDALAGHTLSAVLTLGGEIKHVRGDAQLGAGDERERRALAEGRKEEPPEGES